MRKFYLTLFVGGLAGFWMVASAEQAGAVKFFRKGFEARYVGDEPSTDAQKSIAAAVETTKCWVCHVKGQNKKVRNAYGDALSKLLDKDNFKASRREAEPDKAMAEVQAALEKVEAMKVDPKMDASPTFGDLLKAGKLPAGSRSRINKSSGFTIWEAGFEWHRVYFLRARTEPSAKHPAAIIANSPLLGSGTGTRS